MQRHRLLALADAAFLITVTILGWIPAWRASVTKRERALFYEFAT